MASYFIDNELFGLVITGRVVTSRFEDEASIRAAAAFVEKLGSEHGVALDFVYAGTSINWSFEFDPYTPSLIGIVTYEHESEDDDESIYLPREDLVAKEIPDAIWSALAEYGLELSDATHVYLTVAGWAWTAIDRGEECLATIAAEDDNYLRIDDNEALMKGEGELRMRTSYC